MEANKLNNSRGFLKYTSMAIRMIAAILLFTYVGTVMDQIISWKFPVFTVLGVLFGSITSMYVMIRTTTKK